MAIKVCKFGGTSMSDSKAISRVSEIIKAEKDRRYIVLSAPGKRNKEDFKITDKLYECYNTKCKCGTCAEPFKFIRERYQEIVDALKVKIDLKSYLDVIQKEIDESTAPDYAASRGEYLSALIMAKYLDYEFVDAAEIIRFKEDGSFDDVLTNELASARLSGVAYAVIPGFYGTLPNGVVKTFSRGGSDVSGSIVARAVSADLYENWTDVSGFMTADPRIIDNPKIIKKVSYQELRELSYMGASVLHPDAIFPVRLSGIPINIKNTFSPEDKGTMIVAHSPAHKADELVTGIAGKKDFSVILVEKSMMNSELGFARRIMSVLEEFGISFEHMPSGVDTLSVVLATSYLVGREDKIVARIIEAVSPDSIVVHHGLALIATVGHGMNAKVGTASRIFTALAKANVNVRMIDQGSSEKNIIVGVQSVDYEATIKAIYNEFFGEN
ncbi:MAG: aspartate kinase [Clostridia bacterium]|nr:aspartate kinase [Clostridia bacterium]